LKLDEESVKTPCAWAVCAMQKTAMAAAVKVTDCLKPIGFTPLLFLI